MMMSTGEIFIGQRMPRFSFCLSFLCPSASAGILNQRLGLCEP